MSWNRTASEFVALLCMFAGCMDRDDPTATVSATVELARVPMLLTPLPLPLPTQNDLVVQSNISGLAYISVLGGPGTDAGFGVAADLVGNAYMVGPTALCSPDPFVFVEKLGPTGAPIYAICLTAGPGAKVAADSAGNAYVITGSTLTKIDPQGTALLYSVSLSPWTLNGVAVDATGAAYVVGTIAGNSRDAVVGKIDPAGTTLVYGASFGGRSIEEANDIAVDGLGQAYVVGSTMSSNYPLANASQVALRGFQDVFVAKLNATGTQLLYSTYLGGDQLDFGDGIAVDDAGNAYVTGTTSTVDGRESFPVTFGAAQTVPPGGGDGFVTKFNTGGAKIYSTYLGGSGPDSAASIAVDRTTGSAVVTGFTQSTNFPTVAPFTSPGGATDAFVAQLNPAGSAFTFARYLGGTGNDVGVDVESDVTGHFYVSGETASPVFPGSGGLATHGGFDAFLLKFNP